jgi:deazaflavin-dependent oxidoreductase (nitroreductase family)
MPKRRLGPVLRWLFRAPTRLYGWHLGWLLGRRFLCLTHTGRRSGKRYRTVLEVIGTGARTHEVAVIAGLGRSSDWYQNIQANPAVEVTIGRRRFRPDHRLLSEQEAVDVVADYERRNRWVLPLIRPVLSRLTGWRYDGGDRARRRLVRQLPVIGFRPLDDQSPPPAPHG